MNLRELVNHVIFRNNKYQIVKNNFLKQHFPGDQLQFTFEYIVYHRLSKTKDFNFIQVGANDGKRSDPVWQFVSNNKMKGVLLEPVKYYFNKLKENYSGNDNVNLINKALHPSEKTFTLFRIDVNAIKSNDISDWAHGIATFDKIVLEKHGKQIPNYEKHVVEEKVNCISWDELINDCGYDKLDLLLIDTEGFDYEVIKMVDFSKMKPSIIRFEHSHLSNEVLYECYQLLSENGYKMHYEVCDTTAYIE